MCSGYAHARYHRPFSEDLWELSDEESTIQGLRAAQFVRDATIVRLAFLGPETRFRRGTGMASAVPWLVVSPVATVR